MAWGATSALTGVGLVLPETIGYRSDPFVGHEKFCWDRGLSYIHRAY